MFVCGNLTTFLISNLRRGARMFNIFKLKFYVGKLKCPKFIKVRYVDIVTKICHLKSSTNNLSYLGTCLFVFSLHPNCIYVKYGIEEEKACFDLADALL